MSHNLIETVKNPDNFFLVFASCFPAFTGMTAGVGLSGDLRDSRRAIPLGTMGATLIGMLVYVAIAYKLAISATPAELAGDQLIMAKIAVWGNCLPLADVQNESALRHLRHYGHGCPLPVDRLPQPGPRGLAVIFQGAIFQISRQIQVFLQKSGQKSAVERWRPSVVCISSHSFERLDAFNLLRWIGHRFGFGTYIHYLPGYLSRDTVADSRAIFQRLVRLTDVSHSNIYIDTLISPSYTTAIAQVAQLPDISGKENNLVLFEFSRQGGEDPADIIDNYRLLLASGFDVCILGSTSRDYGYRREIHVWLTPEDYENASLMILLAYIILGHPDWEGGQIKLFAAFPATEIDEQKESLHLMI